VTVLPPGETEGVFPPHVTRIPREISLFSRSSEQDSFFKRSRTGYPLPGVCVRVIPNNNKKGFRAGDHRTLVAKYSAGHAREGIGGTFDRPDLNRVSFALGKFCCPFKVDMHRNLLCLRYCGAGVAVPDKTAE